MRQFPKPFALVLAISCCALPSFAQVKFGIKAGGNFATTVNRQSTFNYAAGYDVGFISELSVSKHLFISSGIAYSAKGNALPGGDIDRLRYLNLPILAGYRISNHFEILGGVEFGYLMVATLNPGHYYSISFLDEYRRVEVAVNGGIRYTLCKNWALDLSFARGLNGIFKPTQKTITINPSGVSTVNSTYHVSERDNSKNQSVQFGLLFFFR